MKTKQSKVTRRITMALSAIMLSEQLAGTGAVLYAHAEDDIKTEYKIEHSVTSSWEGGCNANIILTNLADRDTQDWSITFSTTDEITNLWGGTITECLEIKTAEEEAEIEELEEADDKFEDIFESAFKDEFEDDIFAEFSEEVEEEYIETSDEENEAENTVEVSENATENVTTEEVDVAEPTVVEAETDDETVEVAEATEETEEVIVENQEYDFDAPVVEEYEVYYQYTVKALDYNALIKSGESVTIGYMAEGNSHDIWNEKAEITLKEAEKTASIPVGGTYEYDDYTVEVKIPAYWDGAYNVQLLITNTSDETIHNWAFVMETANTISGLYNAVEVSENDSEEDNVHLIKNAGHNQDIPVGGTVELGYTACYEDDVDVPDDFALSQIETEVTTAECEVSLFISNEWEEGGLAQIIIKNISELPIEDWMIEFDSALDIKEIWGGVIESHEVEHYFIRNSGYAQNIMPGESWTVGILFGGNAADIENVQVRQICLSDTAPNEINDDMAVVEFDTSTASDNVGRIFYKEISSAEEITISSDGLLCVRDQLLITVSGMNYDKIEELMKSYDARIVGCIELTGDYQIEFNQPLEMKELEAYINELQDLDYITQVDLNYIWLEEPNFNTTDPWDTGANVNLLTGGDSDGGNWGLEAINYVDGLVAANIIDDQSKIGSDVKLDGLSTTSIGVIDDAFDEWHNDLKDGIQETWLNYANDVELKGSGDTHGTKVTGVLGATFDNYCGMSGVSLKHNLNLFSISSGDKSWATLLKRDNKNLSEHSFKVKCALGVLVVVANAKAINYSWGSDCMAFSMSRGDSTTDDYVHQTYNKARLYLSKQTNTFASYLDSLLDLGYDFLIITTAGNGNDGLYIQSGNIDSAPGAGGYNKVYSSAVGDTTYGATGSGANVIVCSEVDAKYNSAFNNIPSTWKCYKHIICVGAVSNPNYPYRTNSYTISSFSDRGNRVDILAPGENIYTLKPGGYEPSVSGTSVAAPFVTGAAGLALSVNNKLSCEEVKEYIINSARNIGEYKGLLDLEGMMKLVSPPTPKVVKGFVYTLNTSSVKSAIRYAKVQISKKDGTYISTLYTDENGLYETTIPEGEYTLEYSYNDNFVNIVENVTVINGKTTPVKDVILPRKNMGVLSITITENGVPVPHADVLILGMDGADYAAMDYDYKGSASWESAADYKTTNIMTQTDEKGEVICEVPEGGYFILAAQEPLGSGLSMIGWVDNDGNIKNGIVSGEIREVNVKLQKYADMYGSASLMMQIMGDSNEYINGSKITLYSGWDAVEDATPVMVVADDISKIYAYRYNGGWMEIQTTPGCYTVKIEKEGYETEYRNVLIHQSMYPYIIRMHKEQENLVLTLKDQLGNPYVNYNVVMSKYVNGHFQYWYGLPTDEKGRRVVNTDLPEGQYRLHVYDENDNKVKDIDIVWDKSNAELVDDGFLPNKYYNITIQINQNTTTVPLTDSKYVSRQEILQWIIEDRENYAYNYSFECPELIAHRDYLGWNYKVTETNFNIIETQKLYTWVAYDKNSHFGTNTFDIDTECTSDGAYVTMCGGLLCKGFGFHSSIDGAQDGWRSTYSCQATNGRATNWGGDIYGLTKISAPVFVNEDDAHEFFGYANNYINNPNESTLAELEDYMMNNTKMLNPVK